MYALPFALFFSLLFHKIEFLSPVRVVVHVSSDIQSLSVSFFVFSLFFVPLEFGSLYFPHCTYWGDLGVDGWIILGWISRRWDVGIWTGLGWPRIETGGGRM